MTSIEPARLLYDSARSSASVGVRAGLSVNRSLVFQCGDFSIDLSMHAALDNWGCVYGQVIDVPTGGPVSAASVHLSGTQGSVPTDECGQFSMESQALDTSQTLHVEVDGEEITCEIPALAEAEAI